MKMGRMARLLVLIATVFFAAQAAADPVQEREEISKEDAEILENLDLLESLEFLQEEVVLSDDYEVLDEWEESGHEQ